VDISFSTSQGNYPLHGDADKQQRLQPFFILDSSIRCEFLERRKWLPGRERLGIFVPMGVGMKVTHMRAPGGCKLGGRRGLLVEKKAECAIYLSLLCLPFLPLPELGITNP